MAAGNIPTPFNIEGERERDATKPVQSQGPPPPPYIPTSHLGSPATRRGEPRFQDTGNRFLGARIRSDQGPTHDPRDSRHNREDVYSPVVHRGPDIASDPSVCEGCRVQRSSCFRTDFWGGRQNKKKSKVQNRVLLRKRDGTVAEFMPYGVDKIMGDAVDMNMDKAENTFPIAEPHERHPQGAERGRNLMQYGSEFGTGSMVWGNMCVGADGKEFREVPQTVLSCRSVLFHPLEFIPAEAMGRELPRRCPAYKICKECQF
jgi:hypothetical protein